MARRSAPALAAPTAMVDIPSINDTAGASVGLELRTSPVVTRFRGSGVGRRLKVALSLALGDILAGAISLELLSFLVDVNRQGTVSPPELAASLLLFVLVQLSFGVYDSRRTSPVERFRLRFLGNVVFAIALLVIHLTAEPSARSIGWGLAFVIATAFFGFCFEALLRQALVRSGIWGAPTVIVGTGELARKLANMLLEHPDLGLRPIGFLIDHAEHQHSEMALPIPCLGTLDTAQYLKEPIEVAVLALHGGSSEQLRRCSPLPIAHFILVHDSYEMQSLWLQARPLEGTIGVEIRRNLLLPHSLAVKRFLDLIVAAPLAIITLPLIAILAFAIQTVDRGPAIYRQRRVGRNGKPIEVLKLRTMFADADTRLLDHLQANPYAAEEWGRFLKLTNDPRILPIVGRFLRRTSLDELPQLWNIVRGEMSLVGPRPFPTYHTDRFDAAFQALRMSVTPGLTGLWQISSRSDGDLSTQKAQDSFYIQNWSLWFDIFILLRTIPAVLLARGAK